MGSRGRSLRNRSWLLRNGDRGRRRHGRRGRRGSVVADRRSRRGRGRRRRLDDNRRLGHDGLDNSRGLLDDGLSLGLGLGLGLDDLLLDLLDLLFLDFLDLLKLFDFLLLLLDHLFNFLLLLLLDDLLKDLLLLLLFDDDLLDDLLLLLLVNDYLLDDLLLLLLDGGRGRRRGTVDGPGLLEGVDLDVVLLLLGSAVRSVAGLVVVRGLAAAALLLAVVLGTGAGAGLLVVIEAVLVAVDVLDNHIVLIPLRVMAVVDVVRLDLVDLALLNDPGIGNVEDGQDGHDVETHGDKGVGE